MQKRLIDLRARAVAQWGAVRGPEPSQESRRRGAIVENVIDLQERHAEGAPISNAEIEAIEEKLDATDQADHDAFIAMEQERYENAKKARQGKQQQTEPAVALTTPFIDAPAKKEKRPRKSPRSVMAEAIKRQHTGGDVSFEAMKPFMRDDDPGASDTKMKKVYRNSVKRTLRRQRAKKNVLQPRKRKP